MPPSNEATLLSTHRYFCTYFDYAYIVKGLALYESLVQHANNFTLFVLAFDDRTFEALHRMNLPNVELLRAGQVEQADPEFAATQSNRSRVEYYWTTTPVLPRYLFRTRPEIDVLFYLDADLYFFASAEQMYAELGDASIYLTPHRFGKLRANVAQAIGTFNVGVLGFRNDATGRECLDWWRTQCIEWCYQREEPGRFGDQKYLDDWPERFRGVVVSNDPGCNLAPWNLETVRLSKSTGEVSVNGVPLRVFHFHGLSNIGHGLVELTNPNYKLSSKQRSLIYQPYVQALCRARRKAPTAGSSARTIRGATAPRVLLLGLAILEGRLYWSPPWC